MPARCCPQRGSVSEDTSHVTSAGVECSGGGERWEGLVPSLAGVARSNPLRSEDCRSRELRDGVHKGFTAQTRRLSSTHEAGVSRPRSLPLER